MQLNGLKKLSYLGILYCSFDIIYPVPSLSYDLEGVIETLPEAQRTQGIESLT